MKVIPYLSEINEYLCASSIIDFEDEIVKELSDVLWNLAQSETEYIKIVYEYVRDSISHSADSNYDRLPCSATDVLQEGHGICFAKSHLLAALLRCKSIPAGFCYQRLILDDEKAPFLVYHGLNGVYVREYEKWIRLDARGNKEGVNAQFSIEKEQLAFKIRPEIGEEDNTIVYPRPDADIIKKLKDNKTRTELCNDLPINLAYRRALPVVDVQKEYMEK